MCMLTERFQILFSPEQRKALEKEARRRGISVASLVRRAVDRELGTPDLEARARAVAEIRAMRGRFLAPDELEALIEEERLRSALP